MCIRDRLGLDQWLKHYVTVNIPLGEAQPLLPGVVELRTCLLYTSRCV